MADPVDWTDPCARLVAYREAHRQIAMGGQEIEIRTRTLDAEDLVRFSPGNLSELALLIRADEAACAAKLGLVNPNRRFAITLGARRTYPGCS